MQEKRQKRTIRPETAAVMATDRVLWSGRGFADVHSAFKFDTDNNSKVLKRVKTKERFILCECMITVI